MLKNKNLKKITVSTILAFLATGAWNLPVNQNSNSARASSKIPVDVELVLSVDVSGSISTREFNLQRQGYINAFKDPEVIQAIESLPNGIAVTLQYWSSNISNSMSWHHITDASSATAFANAIPLRPGYGGTNVTAAITSATNLLLNNNYEGKSLVIDVSGDGLDNMTSVSSTDISQVESYLQSIGLGLPNFLQNNHNYLSYNTPGRCAYGSYNASLSTSSGKIGGIARVPIEHVSCPGLQKARDAAIAQGITINGLAILSPNKVINSGKKINDSMPFIVGRDFFAATREDEIDEYFKNNVIGGDGAFVEVAMGFSDYGRAIKEKIKREISVAASNSVYPPD
ncbi:MAG: DUF1194 domain-containing protein [Xenococcaceae cyanobacterium]